MRTSKLVALASLATLAAASSIACSGGTTVTTDPGVALDYRSPVLLECGYGSSLTGDVDGDHHEDLVTLCRSSQSSSTSTLRVYLGGNFDAPVETTVENNGSLYDVDGDGMDDYTTGRTVYFSLGKGLFSSGTKANMPSGGECRFDVDGDGFRDILTSTGGELTAWSISANGIATKLFTVSDVGYGPAFGDLDGDGKLDIFYAKGSSIVARYGKGGGAFSAAQVVVTLDGVINGVRDVDLDGNGKVDVLATMGATGGGTTSGYELLHDDGTGKLSVVKTIAKVDSVSYWFTDATGDGKVDVVLSEREALAVAPGLGNGSFLDATVITGPWTNASYSHFADVNGDGKKDLIVSDSSVAVMLRK